METKTLVRKNPLLIRAVKLTSENVFDIGNWLSIVGSQSFGIDEKRQLVLTKTGEESRVVPVGSWVVIIETGEFRFYSERQMEHYFDGWQD